MELFLYFFGLMRQDLLDMVEEYHTTRSIIEAINSIFLALIPKASHPHTLLNYRSISLYNITYKMISKIVVGHIKATLTNQMIHEAITIAHECIHSIYTKKLDALDMKLHLQKAYDWVE